MFPRSVESQNPTFFKLSLALKAAVKALRFFSKVTVTIPQCRNTQAQANVEK